MSSEPDADGGYVHAPADGADGDDEAGGATDAAPTDGRRRPSVAGEPAAEPASTPEAEGFGRKGWALTAVLFCCVLVIPGIIYAYPYAAGALGVTFFATYLALPLVPAALLGLVAVWSMTAATGDE
ncbi:MAG: hypothetical protein A07HR67_01022 [uncultured archaeon A07HR67]|nr:MAG: hypothetical protein A07HR67_01022 [uncultured archaeon A07HR67]